MSEEQLFCYCFEIPLEEARSDPRGCVKTIRGHIAAQGCWCDRLNPSGKCCMSEMERLVVEPEAGSVGGGLGWNLLV